MELAGREAMAFARQAVLLRHDTDVILPHAAGDGDDVVVLLHGLFASAGVLRPLRARIEAETGAHTASFSYLPGPGVRMLAHRLSALVERLPSGARLHLVGHSMGGLVVRYYVQLLGPDPRVVQTMSLATPFGGTQQARWLPVLAGRDIAPGSEVLRELASTARRPPLVPHTSYVAMLDSVVQPPRCAAFWHGDVFQFDGLGHNALLYDEAVHAAVVRRIRMVQSMLAAPRTSW